MHFLIIPLLAMVVTQGLKMLIAASKKQFNWSLINSYGGMPSSHAALVTSLAFVIGIEQGYASPVFAIAVIVLIITLRDAMGLRYQLGIHGKMLNKIIKDLPDRKEYKYPVLSERFGHTPMEVAAGIIAGLIIAWIVLPLFN